MGQPKQVQQFRVEKFFIDSEENFQSQTMCSLEMPPASENSNGFSVEEEKDGERSMKEEQIVLY